MKSATRILFGFILIVMFSGTVLAQPAHSVWSENKPLRLNDYDGKHYYQSFFSGDAAFAWRPATPSSPAYAYALAQVTQGLRYDFILVELTSSDADSISGRWNVSRNGLYVCSYCLGKAFLLNQPIWKVFRISVGTKVAYADKFLYEGIITRRFDF